MVIPLYLNFSFVYFQDINLYDCNFTFKMRSLRCRTMLFVFLLIYMKSYCIGFIKSDFLSFILSYFFSLVSDSLVTPRKFNLLNEYTLQVFFFSDSFPTFFLTDLLLGFFEVFELLSVFKCVVSSSCRRFEALEFL